MKKDNAEYMEKKRSTGGGPPPSPPKTTELWILVADLLHVELGFAEVQYDSDLREDPGAVVVQDTDIGM